MKRSSNTQLHCNRAGPLAWLKAAGASLVAGLMLPAQAAIVLDVTADKNPVRQGEQSVVRLTISNDGALPENDMTVTVDFPAGLNNLAEGFVLGGLDAGNSCFANGASTTCTAGEALRFAIDTLNPGDSRNYAIPVSVAAATADGTAIDWVTQVTRNGSGDVLAAQTFGMSADSNAVASLAIDPSMSPAAPGEGTVYTLRYGNPTAGNITNASVSVTLPANTTLVSATGSPAVSGNVLTWTPGTIAAQTHRREIIRTTVNAGAGTGTQLGVTGALTGTANFLPTSRQTRQVSIVGNAGPLDVNMYVNPLPARPGERTLLTIDVTNASLSPVIDASVALRYPEIVANTSEALVLGGLDAGASCFRAGATTTCSANEVLSFPIAGLNPGQSLRYSLPIVVGSGAAPGELIDYDLRIFDGAATHQTRTLTVPVDDNAIGTLDVEQSKDPVQPGDTLVYTVHYGNASSGNITGGALTLTLPENTTLVSATNTPAVDGRTLTWNVGTVLAESYAEQTVVVTVSAAAAAGTQLDVHSELNGTANFRPMVSQRTQVASVGANSPLALSLAVNPEPAAPGQQVMFNLNVSNTSALPVVDTVLFLRYPAGMAAVGETLVFGGLDAGGSCFRLSATTTCSPDEYLRFEIPGLNPGQSREFTLPAVVASATAPGTLIDWDLQVFEATGLQTHRTVTLPVDGNPGVTLGLTADSDPVAPGETLTYTLSYGNSANATVTAAEVSLLLPDAVTLVSATGTPMQDGQRLTWSFANLLAESIGQQTVTVTVNAGSAPGTRLDAVADSAGTLNFLPTRRQVSRSGYVNAARPLAAALQVNALPGRPGGLAAVTLTVANRSALPVVDAQVVLRHPLNIANYAEALTLGGINAGSSCFRLGATTTCSSNEALIFDLGTLNPGTSREYRLPMAVAASAVPGSMIDWAVRITESTGEQSFERLTQAVDNNAVANVAVTQTKDPVAPGDELIYTVRYGNESSGNIDDASLTFALPDGVTFNSASTAVGAVDGVVTWDLGTLTAGVVGQHSVRVTVDAPTAPGSVLEATADLAGTFNFRPSVRRAADASVVGASGPLELALVVQPMPAAASEATPVTLRLTNASALPVLDARVIVRVPTGIANFAEGGVTGGIDAAASCFLLGATTTCQAGEFVVFNFAQLVPGEVRELELPATVAASVPSGSLIDWTARVDEGGGSLLWQSVAAPVGVDPTGDTDSDGIGNAFDNCTIDANSRQFDADADGYGNRCDADFDQSCVVNVIDLGRLRVEFFTSDARTDLDGDGVVNVTDLGLLRALFFAPPGPSALPGACN